MNKKRKLPKAIVWTADDMRRAATEPEPSQANTREANLNQRPSGHDGSGSDSIDNVVEMLPKPEIPLARVLDAAPTPAARRRSLALTIVERHANYSAVGGIIPLPIVNFASVTAIIVRMVKLLSRHYGVPFERDRAKTIVIGLMGGAMPSGLAAVTTSTLLYVVPGSNLIGLAVSSVTAAACTRRIGRTFIDHFEGGATLFDFPMGKVR